MKVSLKKVILVTIAAAGVMAFVQTVSANVTGRCDNCHTMHNSQDGINMITAPDPDPTTPKEYLLLLNCINCHSRTDGLSPINATTKAPAVTHTTTNPLIGGEYLAGGSFYWVESQADGANKGHNVDELTTTQADTIVNTPPGDTILGNFNTGVSLQCADAGDGTPGSFTGCHYSGGHHNNQGGDYTNDASGINRGVDGTGVGASYRFLSGGTKGGEDADWEWTSSDTDHNLYAGSNTLSGEAGTITNVCIRCHGDFHGDYTAKGTAGGTGEIATYPVTPWYRHPIDVGLEDSNMDAEHSNYGSYAPYAPIAVDVSNQAFTTDTEILVATLYEVEDSTNGFDRVTCISCHRAHGSENADMLRWSYNTMVAGVGPGVGNPQGCFKCHSAKD